MWLIGRLSATAPRRRPGPTRPRPLAGDLPPSCPAASIGPSRL